MCFYSPSFFSPSSHPTTDNTADSIAISVSPPDQKYYPNTICKRHTHPPIKPTCPARAGPSLTAGRLKNGKMSRQFILALFGRLKISIVFIKSLPSLFCPTASYFSVLLHSSSKPALLRCLRWCHGPPETSLHLPFFAHYWFSLFRCTASIHPQAAHSHWSWSVPIHSVWCNSRKESQGMCRGKKVQGREKYRFLNRRVPVLLLGLFIRVHHDQATFNWTRRNRGRSK